MEDSQSNLKDLQNELENLYNTINQNSIDLDPMLQQIIEENYWDLFGITIDKVDTSNVYIPYIPLLVTELPNKPNN